MDRDARSFLSYRLASNFFPKDSRNFQSTKMPPINANITSSYGPDGTFLQEMIASKLGREVEEVELDKSKEAGAALRAKYEGHRAPLRVAKRTVRWGHEEAGEELGEDGNKRPARSVFDIDTIVRSFSVDEQGTIAPLHDFTDEQWNEDAHYSRTAAQAAGTLVEDEVGTEKSSMACHGFELPEDEVKKLLEQDKEQYEASVAESVRTYFKYAPPGDASSALSTIG